MRLAGDVDPALLLRRRALARRQGRRRLLLLGGSFALLAAVGAYTALAHSSAFAVRDVRVHGGSHALDRDVRRQLAERVTGRNLLRLDAAQLEHDLVQLPFVRVAHVDRAFPHTVAVTLEPYRPAALVKVGSGGYLVASDARVLARVGDEAKVRRSLPRIVLPDGATLLVGTSADDPSLHAALGLLAEAPDHLDGLAGRLTGVDAHDGLLTAAVGHVQLRLGSGSGIAIKLRVADRVLTRLPGSERRNLSYIDLAVPARPALGFRTVSVN